MVLLSWSHMCLVDIAVVSLSVSAYKVGREYLSADNFHTFSTRRSPYIFHQTISIRRLQINRHQIIHAFRGSLSCLNMRLDPSQYPVWVFVIILSCGAGVLLCWAIFRFFGEADGRDRFTLPDDQARYCRHVRIRNYRSLAAMTGRRDIMRELDESLRDDQ
jgi:hypothetical protein